MAEKFVCMNVCVFHVRYYFALFRNGRGHEKQIVIKMHRLAKNKHSMTDLFDSDFHCIRLHTDTHTTCRYPLLDRHSRKTTPGANSHPRLQEKQNNIKQIKNKKLLADNGVSGARHIQYLWSPVILIMLGKAH